jgi:predicted acyltransferase
MNTIPAGRLMTLDAFRGMTIAAMILVNSPGSWDHVYPQLLHAEWVGCTFTDLIFPFFLFIAGVAMWFSFRNVVRDDRWTLLRKILRRAGLIFLVGLFISWFPFYDQTLEKLHWLGVLQRISVSYVIASLICISCGRKWVAAAAALLLLGYWGLIAISGGDEPFARDVVFDRGIDFVAFRSCLTSAVPIMIGYLLGSFIDRPRYDLKLFSSLISVGLVLILLGRIWALEFPIIKSLLWSSSYVIYTVGIGIVLFTLCLWIIEKAQIRFWAFPFVLFGLNPLFLYALSIILDKLTWMISVGKDESAISLHEWIYRSLFQPMAGDINGSLIFAVSFVVMMWLIAWWLYRKNIFIKV